MRTPPSSEHCGGVEALVGRRAVPREVFARAGLVMVTSGTCHIGWQQTRSLLGETITIEKPPFLQGLLRSSPGTRLAILASDWPAFISFAGPRNIAPLVGLKSW